MSNAAELPYSLGQNVTVRNMRKHHMRWLNGHIVKVVGYPHGETTRIYWVMYETKTSKERYCLCHSNLRLPRKGDHYEVPPL